MYTSSYSYLSMLSGICWDFYVSSFLAHRKCHCYTRIQFHRLCLASIVDMLFLSETKIDDSFTDTQFQVNNYHFGRADRTAHGGGIAAYVRSDLPCDRKRTYVTECIPQAINI
jgi:hypothetical protein